jgi:hypothetical protein
MRMPLPRLLVATALPLLIFGCAHKSLSGSDLDRVTRPAFVSRIEEGAGPKALVFRYDGTYGAKLKKLDPKEADRRLAARMERGNEKEKLPGVSRFEVSEGLRSKVLALLPREAPWSNAVDPISVATALESFLVEEVPANAPDYELLRPYGADAVVEFVIEDYGMRSSNGHAGTYVVGYGRMFMLDGGTLWRRSFTADQIDAKMAHVDPFRVGKDPNVYRLELMTLLDGVAQQFAKDLNPPRAGPPPTPSGNDLQGDDGSNNTGRENDQKKKKQQADDDDLPDPI